MRVLCLAVVLVTLAYVRSSPVGSCPDPDPKDRTEHLPNNKDCTKFWHCDHAQPKQESCTPGLHFNPKLQVCDWPNRAGCKAGGSGETGDGSGGDSGDGSGDDSSSSSESKESFSSLKPRPSTPPPTTTTKKPTTTTKRPPRPPRGPPQLLRSPSHQNLPRNANPPLRPANLETVEILEIALESQGKEISVREPRPTDGTCHILVTRPSYTSVTSTPRKPLCSNVQTNSSSTHPFKCATGLLSNPFCVSVWI